MELVCCTSICHFRFGSMLNELIFALMPFLTIVEADTGRRKRTEHLDIWTNGRTNKTMQSANHARHRRTDRIALSHSHVSSVSRATSKKDKKEERGEKVTCTLLVSRGHA